MGMIGTGKNQKKLFILFFILIIFAPVLFAQGLPAGLISIIGMNLDELLARFGTPRSVYAVRGLEEWQDDVVFVYDHGDYYVFKDRVWQAGFKSAVGIKTGDTRAVVSLILGPGIVSLGDSLFLPVDEGNWPLMLRFDFDREEKIRGIYIYRTDFN